MKISEVFNKVPYIAKPRPCFLDGMEKHIMDGETQIYKSGDKYYSWDKLHGEIEVFNKRGRHIMVYDADENYIKPAVKGRKINV